MKRRAFTKRAIGVIATVAMVGTLGVGMVGCGSESSKDSVAAEDIAALEEAVDEAYAKEMTETLAYDEELNDEDTSYRGGGSASEIAASKYLASEFKSIGLSDVTRDEVTVDGWETGESYMNVGNIKIDNLVSYQSTGSYDLDGSQFPVQIRKADQDESGIEKETVSGDWSNMEIVNVGEGKAEDYEGLDVTGKIVLVAVNQYTESWINEPYEEAFYHGAAAIVSYQYDGDGTGYGMYDLIDNEKNCDTINVQDICSRDLIPCGSIAPKDAKKIIAKMKKDDTNTLGNVDFKLTCEVTPNAKAYNVVGKIPGTENTGQQIIIGGHYDKYHGGVNDDCTAVALATSIAKAMIDSGYEPKNDIYIVAHAAEEWGRIGAADDWAMGSWEQITENHPEWQGTTLAFINFEMPAIKSGQTSGLVQTSYEFGTSITEYIEDGLISSSYYNDGIEVTNDHNMGMSDCISYQRNGVPCIINKPDFDEPEQGEVSSSGSWFMDRYHTVYDDMSTYSSELMEYNIAFYGGIAEYIDQNPALELDFTARCDELLSEIEGTDEYLDEDTKSLVDEYTSNLENMKAEGESRLETAEGINEEYAKAVADGESDEELSKIFSKGVELNKTTLEAFRIMEDELMGITGSDTYMSLHNTAQSTLDAYTKVIGDLESGDVTDDGDDCTLATMASIGGYTAYIAYGYSEFTYDCLLEAVNCDEVKDTWGYDKSARVQSDYSAIQSVLAQLYGEGNPDYSEAIEGFNNSKEKVSEELVTILNKEIKGMKKAAKKLN